MKQRHEDIEILNKSDHIRVEVFLKEHYKRDRDASYMSHTSLRFIETCRYSSNDVCPILVRLGYEIGNGNKADYVLPAMASVHLLLLSFIPLDDIIDGATQQKFTEPRKFAENLSLAYALNTRLKEQARTIMRKHYGNSKNYLKIENVLSECIERTERSHALEVNVHSKKHLQHYSLKDYMFLIDEATSEFALSLAIGGLVAGVDEQSEKTMRQYGVELARLAQIRDDFLDYVDTRATGKISFADLLEKRKRFPLLIAYQKGNKSERRSIEEILYKEEILPQDILRIIEMILHPKIQQESRKIIDRVHRRAIQNLQKLPMDNPTYRVLEDLTDFFAMKLQ